MRPIAERKGITLGQLALAWVASHPETCSIAGARNADQVRENAKTGDLTLTDAELSEIDKIGRGVTDFLDDNPVMWEF